MELLGFPRPQSSAQGTHLLDPVCKCATVACDASFPLPGCPTWSPLYMRGGMCSDDDPSAPLTCAALLTFPPLRSRGAKERSFRVIRHAAVLESLRTRLDLFS